MWRLLSAPEQESDCKPVTNGMKSLAKILSELAKRSYANKVYGHFSHECFYIGTAPNYEASLTGAYHSIIAIEPIEDRFLIGYGAAPLSKWGRSLVAGKLEEWGCWDLCPESEVVSLVDRIVTRDLEALSSRQPTSETGSDAC